MKLIVENFQAQRYLELELSNSVTTIVGESDVGKSSTLRALEWLLTNEAPGTDFITWGESECKVTLEDIDGHTVTRLKNKKKNVYILDGQEFACLRQSVPEEIRKIFKIGQDNIQGQHDLQFWFTETGGELAKKLNSIVNLEVVDFVFAELGSKIREAKTVKEVYEERARKREQAPEKLAKIRSFKKNLAGCENLKKTIAQKTQELGDLSKVLNIANNLAGKTAIASRTLDSMRNYIVFFDKLIAKRKEYKKIAKMVDTIKNINIKELPFSDKKLAKIDSLLERREKMLSSLNKLTKNLRAFEELNSKMKKSEMILAKRKNALDKAMAGRCPLCGRKGEIMDGCYINYELGEDV